VKIGVLVAVLCALVFTPGAAAGQDLPEQVKAEIKKVTQAPRVSRCPYARLGVAYYRGRFIHWQLQRDASIPEWRKPRHCADARYLAVLWAHRAKESRQAFIRQQAAIARREAQHPKWIALRLLNGDREQWGCLMYIVSVENATMDPTLDFGHGHGNVYEAYGIPQANPGYKMRSAGPLWRTDPETQLRWMIGYCRERYGSVCGAAYSRRVNGQY
jgi:hypothetical protein